MSGDFAAGDDSDAEALLDLEDFPGLRAVVRFTRLAPDIAWFSRLGAELEDDEIEWAEAYLSALGFPGADVVPILDWEDAEAAADNPDWNSAWWEAEEQLRMALIDEACQRICQTEGRARSGKTLRRQDYLLQGWIDGVLDESTGSAW